MTTLLDLSNEIAELDDLLAQYESPDVPEVANVIQHLLDLTEQRDTKVDNYCSYIRELELRAEARKNEAARLSARAQVSQNMADNLKERLRETLLNLDIKKIETERFTVLRAANGGKVLLIVDGEVPQEFTYEVKETKVDNNKIREKLSAGETLEFARLAPRGEHLRIK